MRVFQWFRAVLDRYPEHSAFVFVFAFTLFLNLSQPYPFVFHYDSNQYWELSNSFIRNGGVSLVNFDNVLRGYFLPFFIFIIRKLASLTFLPGDIFYEIFMSFIYTVFLVIWVPSIVRRLFRRDIGFGGLIVFALLMLYFWRGLFFYPLSDFIAVVYLSLGVLLLLMEKKRWYWFVLIGLLWGGASLIRPSYVVTLPFLLLWSGYHLYREFRLPFLQAAKRWVIIILGLIVVFLPQLAINIVHFERVSPFVQTSKDRPNLFVAQLYWGIVAQKYETNVGADYPGGQIFFLDRHGNSILIKSGYQETHFPDGGSVLTADSFSLTEYLQLLYRYPIDFLIIYTRHFFNGLDVVYDSVYVFDVYDPGLDLRIVNYSLWFLVIAYIVHSFHKMTAGIPFTSQFFLPLIFSLPPILSIPTAIEVRFMLPLHIMAYAVVAFWVFPDFWGRSYAQKKQLILKYKLRYLVFLVLCFTLSLNTYTGLEFGNYVLSR